METLLIIILSPIALIAGLITLILIVGIFMCIFAVFVELYQAVNKATKAQKDNAN